MTGWTRRGLRGELGALAVARARATRCADVKRGGDGHGGGGVLPGEVEEGGKTCEHELLEVEADLKVPLFDVGEEWRRELGVAAVRSGVGGGEKPFSDEVVCEEGGEKDHGVCKWVEQLTPKVIELWLTVEEGRRDGQEGLWEEGLNLELGMAKSEMERGRRWRDSGHRSWAKIVAGECSTAPG